MRKSIVGSPFRRRSKTPFTPIEKVIEVNKIVQHSRFLELPREIQDMIAAYLPANALISLQLSCHSLYLNGPVLPILYYTIRKSLDLRFERGCMDERDGNTPVGRLACSGCKTFHERDKFGAEESKKKGEARLCIGRKGRVFFTPEHSVSFEDLLIMLSAPDNFIHLSGLGPKTSRYYRQDEEMWQDSPHIEPEIGWCWVSYNSLRIRYCWKFAVAAMPRTKSVASSSRRGSQDSPIGLCPHVKLNDFAVIRAMHQALNKSEVEPAWHPQVQCKACTMKLRIETKLERSSNSYMTPVATFLVTREFGSLDSPTDPDWIAQLG